MILGTMTAGGRRGYAETQKNPAFSRRPSILRLGRDLLTD
jgi:hypothetical protein